jgi:hypothetical protein
MQKRKSFAAKAIWALVPALATLLASQAQAVPSFARQTGQDCAACHIGAFGPQLTPFGIKFKLGGYVDSDGKSGKIPLSGMVVADYNRYKVEVNANDPENPDATKIETKKHTGLSEASVFLAGKLTDHIGSFTQITHDGVGHSTSIDQVDLRYADTLTLSGQEAVVGVSVNNNPTLQDPFNTLSAWSFPYTSSGVSDVTAPGVDTASGSLEHRVIGINAYTLVNNIYGELGLFNSLSPSVQSRLGVGRLDEAGLPFRSLSNAPYWRVGYMQDLRTSAWHVGLLGYGGTLKARDDTGDKTKFNDLGVDGSYQFLGNRQHIVTVNGSYLRERTTDTATVDDVTNSTKNTTKNYRLAASYNFMNTYGASLGYFKATRADQNAGNRGFIYQADWTPWGKESSWNAPWANLRLGVQYISFKHYVSYDDATATATVLDKPSDKNSLRLFAWTSF